MQADAIYVVVTPQGRVSDCAAFNMEQATHRYMMEWLPNGLKPTGYVLDQLWRAFVDAGYKVHRIDLPESVEGRSVCRT